MVSKLPTFLIAIGIAGLLVSSTIMISSAHSAFALKKLFACITDASSGGELTFKDYVDCFSQQFHGQLNDEPIIISHHNAEISVTP